MWMKRFIMSMAALLFMIAGVEAQEVYNEIKAKAKATAEDVKADVVVRQISQFKVDALEYLMLKMREQMPDSTTAFLDIQAYSMDSFVNHFISSILDNKGKAEELQVETLKLYMDASYSNPLFNDTDIELSQSYYSNESCLTRFSLDTDWQKALLAIERQGSSYQ